MKNFINKILSRFHNLDYVSQNIKKLTEKSSANKIFKIINSYSNESEIRYVGGCIRKIINNEKVDDIDLATNLNPEQVCEALEKGKINFYKTGIDHGTITAIINENKFEITSLRNDISSDGRHAKVKFSRNWKDDASRRDFTINSIYSDQEGNLFDPYDGKKDLEKGLINFIGDTDKRIKEDYLRILRYIRFFLDYSKQTHSLETFRKLKQNIHGISKLSKERLLDELKKLSKLETLEKLSKDKLSLEIILLIFPELKNIHFFSKLSFEKKNILKKSDFIFLLCLMIIDTSDNTDYFLYKFNISKKDQKRIKIIDDFYKEKVGSKSFTKNNINKIFYFYGKEAVLDILNFRIISSKKLENSLIELSDFYRKKEKPVLPIKAELLITKYRIPKGKELGVKLKIIEEEWVRNNFQITDKQIDNIISN